MNSEKLFLKTPPLRLFFIAAMPGAISMLASAIYQLIDGMMVGKFLGDTAFAALNLAFPFVIINFSIADLVGVGASVPISISLGEGDKERANNYFTCAVMLIVGAGFVIGGILYAAAPLLNSRMGADGDFAVMAEQYMRTYAVLSPVTTIVFAMDNFLRISGKIKGSMVLNIFMSALIVVLEFVFLSVFHWGIWGAALGSALGMAICAVIAFVPFARGKLLLRFTRPRFRGQMIRQIVACGSPNFLNNIAGRITSILMNILLVRLGGETAVSVYGILMYVDGFIQPLLYGMCDSLQPAVGYNWGARRLDRVKAVERCCFAASAVVSLLSALLIFLFPEFIAGLFVSAADAAVVVPLAASALFIFGFTYIVRWFSFAAQSYMLAVEKSLYAACISVCTALVFPVILVAALYPLGLTGLWMNFPGTALLATALAAFVLLRFRREFREKEKEIAAAR